MSTVVKLYGGSQPRGLLGYGTSSHLCKHGEDGAQRCVRQRHDHGGGCHNNEALIVHQKAAHALHCIGNVLLQHTMAGMVALHCNACFEAALHGECAIGYTLYRFKVIPTAERHKNQHMG